MKESFILYALIVVALLIILLLLYPTSWGMAIVKCFFMSCLKETFYYNTCTLSQGHHQLQLFLSYTI